MFSYIDLDKLASFPYVKVRLACRKCSREGGYKLARLADKYGANVRMDDLLRMLVGDCKFIDPRHPFAPRCGAYFADFDRPPKPPDLLTEGRRRMRVVETAKTILLPASSPPASAANQTYDQQQN